VVGLRIQQVRKRAGLERISPLDHARSCERKRAPRVADVEHAFRKFGELGQSAVLGCFLQKRGIVKNVAKALGIPFRVERFRSPEAGMARLDALLDQGQAVGMQSSWQATQGVA